VPTPTVRQPTHHFSPPFYFSNLDHPAPKSPRPYNHPRCSLSRSNSHTSHPWYSFSEGSSFTSSPDHFFCRAATLDPGALKTPVTLFVYIRDFPPNQYGVFGHHLHSTRKLPGPRVVTPPPHALVDVNGLFPSAFLDSPSLRALYLYFSSFTAPPSYGILMLVSATPPES